MSQPNEHEELHENEDLLVASQEKGLPAETPSMKKPATAKPKAKGKAKGKPKGKSKAKAKSGSNKGKNKKVKDGDGDKPTLKRPAASEKAEPKKAEPKKGQGSGSKGCSSWAKALDKEEETSDEQPEEEEMEHDPYDTDFAMDQGEESEANKKDRSKDAKFKRLLAQHQLPSWLEEAYNATLTMKSGRTEKQREIVNAAFDSSGGKLVLSTEKPLFKEMKETYKESVSSHKQKTLPKVLLMGKFHLDESAFQAGLMSGDIEEVEGKDGKVSYAWRSDEHQELRGKRSNTQQQQEKEGTKADAELFANMSKDWKIGLFKPSTTSSSSKGTHLALEDAKKGLTSKQWGQAQKQLSMSAMDKQLSNVKKLLQTVGVDNREDPLWPQLSLGLHLLFMFTAHVFCT